MASLSYTTAARIAAREMRSSRGKFLFVLLSVAIGVAALTGVRGFSASFRTTLLVRARSIMAGDLSARTFQQLTPNDQSAIDSIRSTGVQTTTVVEMVSMASSPSSPFPLLVSVKAVDPTLYPFYGSVDLAPALTLPARSRRTTVAVGDDLLLRLNLHLGDSIKLGNQTFRIAAPSSTSPTASPAASRGPRVLLSQRALHAPQACSLPATAPRSASSSSFHRPPGGPSRTPPSPNSNPSSPRPPRRPDHRLPREQPRITNGLDAATSLLSLMRLVALVLGAVGVAMAMRAHLQQRLDTIAIMKSLGARARRSSRSTCCKPSFSASSAAYRSAGGVAVQLAFPLFLPKDINVPPEFISSSAPSSPASAPACSSRFSSPSRRCWTFAASAPSSSSAAPSRTPTTPLSTPPSKPSTTTLRRSSPPSSSSSALRSSP